MTTITSEPVDKKLIVDYKPSALTPVAFMIGFLGLLITVVNSTSESIHSPVRYILMIVFFSLLVASFLSTLRTIKLEKDNAEYSNREVTQHLKNKYGIIVHDQVIRNYSPTFRTLPTRVTDTNGIKIQVNLVRIGNTDVEAYKDGVELPKV